MSNLRGRTLTTTCSKHGEQGVDFVEHRKIALDCGCMWKYEFPIGVPVEFPLRGAGGSLRPVPESRLR